MLGCPRGNPSLPQHAGTQPSAQAPHLGTHRSTACDMLALPEFLSQQQSCMDLPQQGLPGYSGIRGNRGQMHTSPGRAHPPEMACGRRAALGARHLRATWRATSGKPWTLGFSPSTCTRKSGWTEQYREQAPNQKAWGHPIPRTAPAPAAQCRSPRLPLPGAAPCPACPLQPGAGNPAGLHGPSGSQLLPKNHGARRENERAATGTAGDSPWRWATSLGTVSEAAAAQAGADTEPLIPTRPWVRAPATWAPPTASEHRSRVTQGMSQQDAAVSKPTDGETEAHSERLGRGRSHCHAGAKDSGPSLAESLNKFSGLRGVTFHASCPPALPLTNCP